MNPQIELLAQIQDVDLMIRELGNAETASAEKKLGFEIRGLETLKGARELLAQKVDSELLKKYERVRARFPRAVVPMRDGVCFGCFVRQPAKRSVTASDDPDAIESCQHCSRILFRFRFP